MARYVHFYTGEKTTGCCGKTVSSLGLGALLNENPAEVSCPRMPQAVDEREEAELDLDELQPDGGSEPLPQADLTEAYAVHAESVKQFLEQREGDQPLPVPNNEPDIQSQVIGDIVERREVGIKRYGTALQPWNGRDALRDLYEELLDGAMYIKQCLVERGHLVNRIAELEMHVAELQAEKRTLTLGFSREKYEQASGGVL